MADDDRPQEDRRAVRHDRFTFFLFGGIFALLIRSELAVPGLQFVDPESYNQLFSMHGTTMIFLFVMPMMTGLANYIVPLQIGAADMAFPRINALSFWMVPLGGLLLFSRLCRSAAPPTPAGPATRRSPDRAAPASTCG